jgi:hypothetical protein
MTSWLTETTSVTAVITEPTIVENVVSIVSCPWILWMNRGSTNVPQTTSAANSTAASTTLRCIRGAWSRSQSLNQLSSVRSRIVSAVLMSSLLTVGYLSYRPFQ